MTDRGVPRGQEYGEGRREIDVLVAQRYEHTPPGTPQLSVQHGIENGVIALDILYQQGVAKTQRRLKVLAEGVIQETE